MTSEESVVEAPSITEADEDAGPGPQKRADARRNHERLVRAAHEVFAEEGGSASMEAIARRAGVGVGTLYRHFPKRIDLVEAVYREDVDELVGTAERVVAELEPWPAVEAFFEAFVRYAKAKRTLLTELHEAFEKTPDLRVRAKERIDQAMQLVIGRARQAGAIRSDVDGSDLMYLLVPVCTNTTASEDQISACVRIIQDGLRQRS